MSLATPATSSEETTGAVRVSASRLWPLLRANYEACGVEAWTRGVLPTYVTSNASVAHRYVRVMMAWLRDLEDAGRLRPGEPLHILELGCGSGRLTFHALSSLDESHEAPILRRHPWQYMATDVSAHRLEGLHSITPLGRFFEDGRLSTSIYDALGENKPEWPDEFDGPVVVIANYVFDSLPADAFFVQDGELYETLIQLGDANAGANVDQLTWRFSHRPVTSGYYNDVVLDDVLEKQKRDLTPRSILLPTGAVQALRNVRQITERPKLVLIADKPHRLPSEQARVTMPPIELHGSSHFSVSLDFNVLAQIIRAEGEQMLVSRHGHEVISFAACMMDKADCAFPEARQAFADQHERLGAHSELYLAARLHEQVHALSLHDHLAWLRMVRYDPHNWSSVFPIFVRLLKSPPPELRPELVEALEQVSARWFPDGDEQMDAPFFAGCAFFQIGEMERARRHLERSIAESGSRPAVQFQLGRAEFLCGDRSGGAARARGALDADRDLGRTLDLLGVFPEGQERAKLAVADMEWQAGLPAQNAQS